jgi:hypothetical protein
MTTIRLDEGNKAKAQAYRKHMRNVGSRGRAAFGAPKSQGYTDKKWSMDKINRASEHRKSGKTASARAELKSLKDFRKKKSETTMRFIIIPDLSEAQDAGHAKRRGRRLKAVYKVKSRGDRAAKATARGRVGWGHLADKRGKASRILRNRRGQHYPGTI